MSVDWDFDVPQWKKDLAQAKAKRARGEHLATWEMEEIADEQDRIAEEEKRRASARSRMG